MAGIVTVRGGAEPAGCDCFFIMAGLEPAIQEWSRRLDGRVKPGHD
ncbi:hypothetical protein [Geminicoccus harenae]|nr:hypothetical protein [Geminicoccus harenae]